METLTQPGGTSPEAERGLSSDEIEISYFEEKNLETVCAILYEANPAPFWDIFEPVDLRPPETERHQRFAARLRPLLSQPCAHGIIATHKPTNAIVGAGIWHEPGASGQFPTLYPAIPGMVFPSCFTPCFTRDTRDIGVALGWDTKYGWSASDLDMMWSGVSPMWGEILNKYDQDRAAAMGDRPHWYLASLAVLPSFQRRGIASLLVQWGMDRAREQKARAARGELEDRFKDACCYLQSEEHARSLYMRLGFQPPFQDSDVPEKRQVMLWAP